MRVTAETKSVTRKRIVDCAAKLFERKGFEKSTTRDIARLAKIATGTLFNYFPHKEAVGLCIVAKVLETAYEQFENRSKSQNLEEELFSFLATCLRNLKPYRHYLIDVIESTLSPLVQRGDEVASSIRCQHLERVSDIMRAYVSRDSAWPSTITLHLYWTLFLGVLAFWAGDDSRNQENTLALLDQSMAMFVGSLPLSIDGPTKESRP